MRTALKRHVALVVGVFVAPACWAWRARRVARGFRIPALVLIAAMAGGALWWATSLVGLPDVGDPFDVAAFRAEAVPDDRGAFALYRQALGKLTVVRRRGNAQPSRASVDPLVAWSAADPALREWAAENREALDLFRAGADRSEALLSSAGKAPAPGSMLISFAALVRLALLEGSRLEERGDMAGAWGWYRAILFMTYHHHRRGNADERSIAANYYQPLVRQRAATWAADRRTDAALLRRALRDALACEPRVESDVHTLKAEYLAMMSQLDEPYGVLHEPDGDGLPTAVAGVPWPPPQLHEWRRFLGREPERSRRVLRLVFADWLAALDPAGSRPSKPALRVVFRARRQNHAVLLYDVPPEAPPAARALSPQALAGWLVSTSDARRLLGGWSLQAVRRAEHAGHRALVIVQAEALYERERGAPPPSEEALVGTYLERLPDDGSDELDDGTVPAVEDPAAAPAYDPLDALKADPQGSIQPVRKEERE
jgi:hypothetical protein